MPMMTAAADQTPPKYQEPACIRELRKAAKIAKDELTGDYSNWDIRARFAFAMLDTLVLDPELTEAERAGDVLYHIAWLAAHYEMNPGETPEEIVSKFVELNHSMGNVQELRFV